GAVPDSPSLPRRARPPLPRGLRSRLGEGGMRGEPEVVVRAEVQELAALGRAQLRADTLERPQATQKAALPQLSERFLEEDVPFARQDAHVWSTRPRSSSSRRSRAAVISPSSHGIRASTRTSPNDSISSAFVSVLRSCRP